MEKKALKIVNLKVSSKDRKALVLQAKKHAKGNLSAWLRHAGLKYVPKKNEKVVNWPIYNSTAKVKKHID